MKECKERLFIHWTPKGNALSIQEHGLMPFSEIDTTMTHIEPYDVFESSKRHKDGGIVSREDKGKFIYFGNVQDCKTLKEWSEDDSFIGNHIGYQYKAHYFDHSGYRNDRERVKDTIQYSQLKTATLILDESDIDKMLEDYQYVVHYDRTKKIKRVYTS